MFARVIVQRRRETAKGGIAAATAWCSKVWHIMWQRQVAQGADAQHDCARGLQHGAAAGRARIRAAATVGTAQEMKDGKSTTTLHRRKNVLSPKVTEENAWKTGWEMSEGSPRRVQTWSSGAWMNRARS